MVLPGIFLGFPDSAWSTHAKSIENSDTQPYPASVLALSSLPKVLVSQ